MKRVKTTAGSNKARRIAMQALVNSGNGAPCCASVCKPAPMDPTKPDELIINFFPCPERIPIGHVMCAGHWRMVPRDNRKLIFELQGKDKHAGRTFHSQDWMDVVRDSIKQVFSAQVVQLAEEVRRARNLRNIPTITLAAVLRGPPGADGDPGGDQRTWVFPVRPDGQGDPGKGPAPADLGGDEPGPFKADGATELAGMGCDPHTGQPALVGSGGQPELQHEGGEGSARGGTPDRQDVEAAQTGGEAPVDS